MNREETMAAFQRVGEYCKAKGYHDRLPIIRQWWFDAKRGEPLGDYAQQLLETWQLPPYENALRVLPSHSKCPTCKPGEYGALYVVAQLEDRTRVACRTCKTHWLEFEKNY